MNLAACLFFHTDRGLLYLILKYEENGVSTSTYRYISTFLKYEYRTTYKCRPYLWGPAALEHYQQKQASGWLLWKEPGVQELMGLIDRKCLNKSITEFPVHVELEVSADLFFSCCMMCCKYLHLRATSVAYKPIQTCRRGVQHL